MHRKRQLHGITRKHMTGSINLIVRKGKRKQISDYAASQGKSMNRFINDAIDAQMPPEKTEK